MWQVAQPEEVAKQRDAVRILECAVLAWTKQIRWTLSKEVSSSLEIICTHSHCLAVALLLVFDFGVDQADPLDSQQGGHALFASLTGVPRL